MKILFFAALPYDSRISGRTRCLADLLAKQGHEIAFVEMPSLRRPFSFLRGLCSRNGVRVVALPPFPFGWRLMSGPFGWLWVRVARLLLVFFCGRGWSAVVSTPWWCRLVLSMKLHPLIYDFLDHLSVMTGERGIRNGERYLKELLSHVSGVAYVRESLRREWNGCGNALSSVIPNGVPGDWVNNEFAPRSFPGRSGVPRIGFVGALYEWIDFELIRAVAERLPEYDFILIGPVRRKAGLLPFQAVGNIHLLAPVPFAEVPYCIAAFAVCMIPFRRDVIAEYADPLKLYEYSALGKPVVSTVEFNAGSGAAVAADAESFASAVERAVKTPGDPERIREFARTCTWECQAGKMIGLLERASVL